MVSETGMVTPGRFVWHELLTHEPEKSRAFYEALFGWRFDADGGYTHILLGDAHVGGMLKAPMPQMPANWLSYISVEDVDAATQKAAAVGCKVLAPTMTIEGTGKFSVIEDPQGAVFALWRSDRGDPPELTAPIVGTFCWDQLMVPDVNAAFGTYAKLFDWSRIAMDAPNLHTVMRPVDDGGPGRTERQAGSIMQAPPGTPPQWLGLVLVKSLEATSARVRELGGKVLEPRVLVPGVGAYAVCEDFQGAVFAVFTFGAAAP